jgi:anti-sigma regulatory factor (Ser/Thr protein kinase)
MSLHDAAASPEGLRLEFRASPTGLSEVQPLLREYLEAAGLAGPVADRAELLVEEVVMNVFMHGFDDSADAIVELRASVGGPTCTLVFEDAGRPFDPTAGALPDRPKTLAEAEVGGLGLVLLRKLATDLAYERLADGRNRLRVLLAQAPPGPPA